jgi:hypothetical protein
VLVRFVSGLVKNLGNGSIYYTVVWYDVRTWEEGV